MLLLATGLAGESEEKHMPWLNDEPLNILTLRPSVYLKITIFL